MNDYFGPTTQQGVLFSRTKIEMSEDTSLKLKARDGEEVIEIRLRNYESSRSAKADQPKSNREFLRIDQQLDGTIRLLVQMGLPCLLHPKELNEPNVDQEEDKINEMVDDHEPVQLLLVGAESDPHLFVTEQQDELIFDMLLAREAEDKIDE